MPRIYDDDLGNSRTTRYTDRVHRCDPRCCIPASQRCPLGTDEFSYKLKKGDGWQRKKGYARWVSDVLIFHVGIALIRSDAVQVDMVEVLDTIDLPSKGLGDNPTGLLVTYMGGGKATIAVSAQNLDAALGPLKDSAN